MAKTKTSEHYRRQIRAAKVRLRPLRLGAPIDRWIHRNHDRICDYLAGHLRGPRELACWDIAYAALHELLGAAWFQPRHEDPGDDEARLWATFEPAYFALVHDPALRPFSGLPNDFSPRGFQHHYEGFFHFLAREGATTEANADRLALELHRSLWGEARGVA